MTVDIGRWLEHDSGYPCKGSRPGYVYKRSRSVRYDREHQPVFWKPLDPPASRPHGPEPPKEQK